MARDDRAAAVDPAWQRLAIAATSVELRCDEYWSPDLGIAGDYDGPRFVVVAFGERVAIQCGTCTGVVATVAPAMAAQIVAAAREAFSAARVPQGVDTAVATKSSRSSRVHVAQLAAAIPGAGQRAERQGTLTVLRDLESAALITRPSPLVVGQVPVTGECLDAASSSSPTAARRCSSCHPGARSCSIDGSVAALRFWPSCGSGCDRDHPARSLTRRQAERATRSWGHPDTVDLVPSCEACDR